MITQTIIRFDTLDEFKTWLEDAWPVGIITDEFDSSGNHWVEQVYQYKKDKYYSVCSLDGNLSPVRPKKRTADDWYEIREVKKITRTEIVEDWEFI
jgi:hypothetical protein